VHSAALGAHTRDDGGLDGLVDVLAVGQGAVTRRLYVVERGENLACRVVGDDSLLCEHHDVGAVDGEVGLEDTAVGREAGEEAAGGAAAEAVTADDGVVVGAVDACTALDANSLLVVVGLLVRHLFAVLGLAFTLTAVGGEFGLLDARCDRVGEAGLEPVVLRHAGRVGLLDAVDGLGVERRGRLRVHRVLGLAGDGTGLSGFEFHRHRPRYLRLVRVEEPFE
jgi:hypothetical protein